MRPIDPKTTGNDATGKEEAGQTTKGNVTVDMHNEGGDRDETPKKNVAA